MWKRLQQNFTQQFNVCQKVATPQTELSANINQSQDINEFEMREGSPVFTLRVDLSRFISRIVRTHF
jgi:hypothetical protein